MATTLVPTAETDWANAHPVPESSVAADLLTLWNYPVGKSALSTTHQQAIRAFLQNELLGPASSPVELTVRGHASDSGDAQRNVALSRDRAQAVAEYLRQQGFRTIDVSWAGATEPLDPGSSGLALARNRRVDIRKYIPSKPDALPPIDLGGPPDAEPAPAPPQPQSAGASPSLPTPSSASFELPISQSVPTLTTSEIVITSKVEGTLKVKVDDNGGGWGGSLILKDGSWTPSAKLETEIRKGFTGKIGFEPPASGEPATLKVGADAKNWWLKPEMGLQVKPNFLYLNITLTDVAFPDIEVSGLHVSMVFVGKLKCEIGPGPAMLLRLRGAVTTSAELLTAVAPLAATTAAVGGALGVTVLIIGGTAYAIQQAKEDGLQFARLLAQRDGASSRVALEVIGTDAQVAYADRKLQWGKTQISMDSDFKTGVKGVEAMLGKPDDRTAKATAWTAQFAADGTADFTLIRERVFQVLGGYNKDGAIADALSAL